MGAICSARDTLTISSGSIQKVAANVSTGLGCCMYTYPNNVLPHGVLYHNPTRLRRIERWANGAFWFWLVALVFSLVVGIYNSIMIFVSPEMFGLIKGGPYETSSFLAIQLSTAAGYLKSIVFTAGECLMLLGIARLIRYLRALYCDQEHRYDRKQRRFDTEHRRFAYGDRKHLASLTTIKSIVHAIRALHEPR